MSKKKKNDYNQIINNLSNVLYDNQPIKGLRFEDNIPDDYIPSVYTRGGIDTLPEYYNRSSYDGFNITPDNIEHLNTFRAENQGFFSTAGNALGRVALNIIPTVIGNTASILDFEDYYNQDKEVGNAITAAMEEFKASVNQDYLPIYRRNPNASFDIGDSAWWLENGGALTESIGAFAITGAGLGAGFNLAGKGLSTIRGLSNLGQAGKAAATVLSSAGLNQAESITTAMQVYDSVKAQGGSDEDAADAAAYSVNINRANIALNLTSAGAFIRSPKATRQIREAFNASRGQMLSEGGQEYLEETINYIAQQEGERAGTAAAKGEKYKFDFQNVVNDALSAEGIESGVLGFLGGVGQTSLTRVYNRMTGEAARQDQLYSNQQQSIARIKQLQDAELIPNVTNIFNSIEKNTSLQNEINDELAAGNDSKAKELQYQLLNNQIVDALENGTVQQLEDVYNNILSLDTETAQSRGLDVEPNSPYYYKKKAQEAITLLNDVEDSYLTVLSKGYLNIDEVLNTSIQNKTLNRLVSDLRKDLATVETTLREEKFNSRAPGDIDSEVTEEIESLPSYEQYKATKDVLEDAQKELRNSNSKLYKITTPEYQSELRTKEQERIDKEAKKAEEAARVEEEKQVKKNQKESVKKVKEDAQVKKNDLAEDEISLQPAERAEEIPLPTMEDIPAVDINDMPNVQIEEELPTDVDSLNDRWQSELEDLRARYEAERLIDNNTPEPTEEINQINDKYKALLNDLNKPTVEDKAVAKIVEQDEVNEAKKEIKRDGLVKPARDLEKINNGLKYSDETRKRDVGNTIISLNIDYVETVLGNTQTQTNNRMILDTYTDSGDIIINKNFDSRLQSPNQFGTGTEVKIIIPSYEEMGNTGYSNIEYTNNIDNIDSFPIAFVDSNNQIIGYLPTQDNVRNRVNPEYVEAELIKNRQLRETIFNNRDKEYTVKITRKSPGSLITNKPSTRKSIYNALGNNSKLADNVSIAVFKDNKLQTQIGQTNNSPLINKSDLEEGYVYAVLPTAETGNYIATPLDISRIGEDNARTVLKIIQLYKANPEFSSEKSLINERNELAREIDLTNINDVRTAINSIIYSTDNINTKNDNYLLKFGDKKLILGVSPDMNFTWSDVMNNKVAQDRIVDILSKRYHAVELSKFGNRFNQYKVNSDNKLEQIRHRNYFDYLNKDNVLNTNVQGIKVDGTDNEYYFTAQSVIEISDPYVTANKVEEAIQEPEVVPTPQLENTITYSTEVGDITYTKDENGDLVLQRQPKIIEKDAEEVKVAQETKKPIKANHWGIKYKPKKSNKNTPQIDEDISFMNSISNQTVDKQAEELMKKCGK